MPLDFTVSDTAGKPWTLSEHLDAAVVMTFHRGDF
jgi:peroxiredoxin